MSFDELISDIMATVIGGSILALLFFWIREKFFPFPNIVGHWYFEMHTTTASYKPYEGRVLRYMAILWREGNRIQGTIEKIYETSSNGEKEYIGKDRTRGVVEGCLEQNYFTKDRMFLHVVEDGPRRESINFYEIMIKSDHNMDGTFTSTIADQDGTTIWQRSEF